LLLYIARLAAAFGDVPLLPHVGQLYALLPAMLGKDDFGAAFPHVGQYDVDVDVCAEDVCDAADFCPQVAQEKESVRPL
jgi:hypothetical protein